MKKKDMVVFNDFVPSYLVKKFGTGAHEVGDIDKNGWVFFENDPGDPKERLHQRWLKVVEEA